MPQILITGTIREGNTATLTFTFRDNLDALITTLDTCVLDYDDNATSPTAINSRASIDCLDSVTNPDFAFSAGILTWKFRPNDAKVSSASGNLITIAATYNNGWGAGEGAIKESFTIKVSNLLRVTI